VIKKIVIWAFSILLLSSVALNVLLYGQLRKYYTQLYAAELDPLGLAYFQDQTTPQSDGKPTVVFFGDSRASQWMAPPTEGFSFINRGIENQTSTQVLLRFEEHVQPLQPEIIILQVCINDLKTIPLFPKRKQEIIDVCKENIEKIVQKSLGLNSTIILTTVIPIAGDVPLARRLVWSEDIYKAIDEVNSSILSVQRSNVMVFDTTSILSDSDGNIKDEYVFDLVHLNSKGYEVLNLELVKILKSLE
jgi:lysophospholipase L1-like esterase